MGSEHPETLRRKVLELATLGAGSKEGKDVSSDSRHDSWFTRGGGPREVEGGLMVFSLGPARMLFFRAFVPFFLIGDPVIHLTIFGGRGGVLKDVEHRFWDPERKAR